MTLTRRTLLAAAAALPAFRQARAADDPRLAERSIGSPDAKVTVLEYFSLTCTHCAAFQRETFPQVKQKLIDTGRVRYVWKDYPLDQVALMAAMVARALPPERYEPFITALLTTQDRWAFARNINPTEELAKMAALAGMARPTFDATIRDDKLKQAILAVQDEGEKKYGVNSTPSFIMNGKLTAGAVPYDTFAKAVDQAAAA
ncbi:MAG: DsbA family protein [Acetobacteraceae bacterium]|nr:DsbA family protein [Acetobacteraceae bacterium]